MNTRHYYLLVFAIRFLLAMFPPSYIHPDEFFQSQEVLAGSIFGTQIYRPWEFRSNLLDPTQPPPSRTIVTPGLTSGSSYVLLSVLSRLFNAPQMISGRTLLYLPRIFMMGLTLLVDFILLSLCSSPAAAAATVAAISPPASSTTTHHTHNTHNTHNTQANTMKYLLATSWVATSYFPRPFSNTCELVALAGAFGVLLLCSPGKVRSMALGCILAVGTFTRFTFVVYFLPVGVALVLQHDALHLRQFDRRAKDRDDVFQSQGNSTGSTRVQAAGQVVLHGFIGAVTTTACFVCVDTVYFGRFTIAPLNNALYNMNSSNLAEHGIHPRWLHCLVNMHVLFGPLTLLTYGILLERLYRCKHTPKRSAPGSRAAHATVSSWIIDHATCAIDVNVLSLFCIAFSLGCLSLAPHQEARFLLPLLVPVLLVCSSFLNNPARPIQRFYTPILIVVVLFNATLLLLFGVLHQGGLLRSILHLEQLKQMNAQTSSYRVYYYKTHMPPRFMLSNYGSPGDLGYVDLVDLKGAGLDVLKAQLSVQHGAKGEHRMVTLVVAPKSVHFMDDLQMHKCFTVKTSFWPHLSMEDLPHAWSELELEMYERMDACDGGGGGELGKREE